MIKLSACLLILTTINSNALLAQSGGEQKAIEAVLNQLVEGMAKGDSAMVHAVFADEVTLVTLYRDKNNNTVLHRENSVQEFLKQVGTPHKETWHEEIWDVKTLIDGDFAQVWCSYAFYVDNTFSHCGIDAFHLSRTSKGWKVFHLADTRRKSGCQIPTYIADKHK